MLDQLEKLVTEKTLSLITKIIKLRTKFLLVGPGACIIKLFYGDLEVPLEFKLLVPKISRALYQGILKGEVSLYS